jgi:1-acyl-sn-glycerol-3-phosphate acyltransferase
MRNNGWMAHAIVRSARALARILGMVAATVVLFVILQIGLAVTRGSIRWRTRVMRWWSRAMLRCMGVRTTISGTPPTGAFILVSNHISYVDIPLIAQFLDVVFVAMTELSRAPGLSAVVVSGGTIFIDRNSRRDAKRVSEAMENVLRAGCGVALFPESTSTDGHDVLPFKAALLEGAARAERPVHFAVIRYAQEGVAWWGDIDAKSQFLGLLQMPRIDATIEFCGTVTASDRKELATRLWTEVRARVIAE